MHGYVLLLVITAVASVSLAIFVWRQRQAPAARPFVWLVLAGGEWALGYALELNSADLATKIFWVKVYYLGIVLVPTMWLLLALHYTGRNRWLTRRNSLLFAIMPTATVLMIWTNEIHGLFWRAVQLELSGPFTMLDWTHGPWFWVYAAYSNLLLVIGTVLLVQTLIHSPPPYRWQATTLLVGALVPWGVNAVYMFGLSPFLYLDPTPFTFLVTGLTIAWGLFRFQFLDIVPVACDAVIESLNAGVIVLDAQDRIVDLNPAAGHILDCSVSAAIGQPLAQVLADQPDLAARYRDLIERHAEVALHSGESLRIFDLHSSPLYDRNRRVAGRLIVLHDISEHKRVEERLRYLSTHDSLTDLYNRAYFEDELTRLERSGPFPISVIMADLDGLKAINDALGHAVGDDLLRRAAGVLRSAFRPEDVVARIGGDEFAVLLPGMDGRAAESALTRVRERVLAHNATRGDAPPVVLSLGSAMAKANERLAEALKRADISMYRDKYAQADRRSGHARPPAGPVDGVHSCAP